MPTIHECFTKALLNSGITVNITAPDIIQELRQYCRDNKNTLTNEYPKLNDAVEGILRRFFDTPPWRDDYNGQPTPDCPECGSNLVIRGHHTGDAAAPECDYWSCEDCDYTWGHE